MKQWFNLILLAALLAGFVWVQNSWSGQAGNAYQGETVSGGALRLIDGDSFKFSGEEIRLYGIDAPEGPQKCTDSAGAEYACGRMSAQALRGILEEPGLVCEEVARDKYGRMVSLCATDMTPDISAAMVHRGHAIALTLRGKTAYSEVESKAEAAKRGIWQGKFQRPSDWRNDPTRSK